MAETARGQTVVATETETETGAGAGGKGLIGPLSNGGSDGGENGGGSFGLGVGFALSPELAQKVRFINGTKSVIS